MILYGDEYSQINGKIVENDKQFLHIYVDTLNRALIIPKYLIKNNLSLISEETQVIQLPKWFLRKNKMINTSNY